MAAALYVGSRGDAVISSGPPSSGDSKAMTVVNRIHANSAKERSSHDLRAAEARLRGNDVATTRRRLEAPAGCFDPGALDESGRCHADFAREYTREIASAHGRLPRKRCHREVAVRMLADPRQELAERLPFGGL